MGKGKDKDRDSDRDGHLKARAAADQVLAEWIDRDLSADHAAGKLPPAFEVDEIIERIGDVLAAGRHPILVGEPGVGKSAVWYEVVRRVAAGAGPRQLAGKRIVQISLRRRSSTLKDPKHIGKEFGALVAALRATAGEVVPFFRDLHLAYSFDLESQLEVLGHTLDAPILGEGRPRDIKLMVEAHADLNQLYVPITLAEPTLPTMHRLVRQWATLQRSTQGWEFGDDGLEQALYLSHRFLSRTLMPRKALDLLAQVGAVGKPGEINRGPQVIQRFCQTYRVPRLLVDPSLPLDLDGLSREFRDKLLGQDDAVSAVVNMVGLIKSGLSDVRRPFGVFLFCGPTGVGKTHLGQLLAEFLFGSRDRMVRINMADFPTEEGAPLLFGNPHGYNVGQQRGLLTQRLADQPFAVLLLDEFEKAHKAVHDRFLQLFDEGVFINGLSETVSCRSLIIIATSNVGAELFRQQATGFVGGSDLEPARARALRKRLEETFRFEFLNRFDHVVQFRPLSRHDIRQIARRELDELRRRPGLAQQAMELEVDESVLDWLVVHGYDPDFGARFLRRTIERDVVAALARALLASGEAERGAARGLSVRVRGGRIHATARRARAADVVAGPAPGGRADASDPGDLPGAIRALLQRAAPLRAALAQHTRARAELVEQMGQAGVWDDVARRAPLLDRFRELDVRIHAEQRHERVLARLDEVLARPTDRALRAQAAAWLRDGERALRRWQIQDAEAGADPVWLVISSADPLRPCPGWVEQLAAMELAYAQQLGLAPRVAAVSFVGDELARVALEVEGRGAALLLSAEPGLHRTVDVEQRALRATIELVPDVAFEADVGPRPSDPRDALGSTFEHRARLELPARGLALDWYGDEPSSLGRLVRSLGAAWAAGAVELEVARSYGEGGGGARDPRTGASVTRVKEALRGGLEPFLEAFLDRDP